jgi:hypothetical protein
MGKWGWCESCNAILGDASSRTPAVDHSGRKIPCAQCGWDPVASQDRKDLKKSMDSPFATTVIGLCVILMIALIFFV